MKSKKSIELLTFLFLICIISDVQGQSVRSLMKNGNEAFKAQNFAQAQAEYNKANALKPSFNGQFNEANALYQQNKYKEAAELNMSALGQAKNNKEKAMASYNLGNSFYKAEDFNKAIDAYKQSLRLDPSDLDAKKNLTKALEKKKQKEKQQQDNKDQKKDSNQDQKNKSEEQKNSKKDSDDSSGQDSDQQPQSKQDQQKQEQQQGKPRSLSRQEAENMLRIMKQEEQITRAKLMKRQRPEERNGGKDW